VYAQGEAEDVRKDREMNRTFPALTLWQPWASLIFTGHKRHETRGFRLPDRLVGEVVAIHAALRSPGREGQNVPEDLWWLARRALGDDWVETIPYGEVLGVVRFGNSGPTETGSSGNGIAPASEDDRTAGDWTPGRYAWPIFLALKFDRPVPAKGRQGWWKFDLDGITI
jgi:hypothetical protein